MPRRSASRSERPLLLDLLLQVQVEVTAQRPIRLVRHLLDLTLDRPYSAICGFTESDLDAVFAQELAGLDRERIREWYNGYRWRGEERVYNPFDVLLLFDSREFNAHWFETGTPALLLDTLFERRVSSVSLSDMLGTEDLLSAFDANNIGTVGIAALLFLTGILTITAEEELGGMALYRLGFPNRAVRQSLNEHQQSGSCDLNPISFHGIRPLPQSCAIKRRELRPAPKRRSKHAVASPHAPHPLGSPPRSGPLGSSGGISIPCLRRSARS